MESLTTARGHASAYRPDIDGLRAIAVLAVLVYHAFPTILPGGFAGVDVFFVLSGFLITRILLGDLDRGRFSIRRFYARRIRRIFPALAAVLAACLAFGWFALFPDEYGQLGRHARAGATFLANFTFWREAGYFDNAGETKPLLHLWSLGIEEQFYIVWPLLLLALARVRRRVAWVLAGIAALSFAIDLIGLDRDPVATFYSPASRAWELALGGLLAAIVSRPATPDPPGRRSRPTREALGGLGAAALLAGFAVLRGDRPFPGLEALLPTVGTALLVAAGPQAWVSRRVLALRPLVAIGLVSYPLYLWHWPLLSFARVIRGETQPVAQRIVLLALAALLAVASWRWLETPVRGGGPSRRKVAGAAAAMALVALLGAWVKSARGFPGRESARAGAALLTAFAPLDDRAASDTCRARFGLESEGQWCLVDDPNRQPTVALVGDSHARHLYEGLAAHFRERGENLLYVATRVPFWDVPAVRRDAIQQATGGLLDFVRDRPTVKTVILSTALHFHEQTAWNRLQRRAFETTLDRFVGGGQRVVFVRDVPRLDFDPRSCVGRPGLPGGAARAPCAIPRAAFDAATARHDAVLAAVLLRHPEVEWFDVPAVLCGEERCDALRDGQILYRDRDHLSRAGELLVGGRFVAERPADSELVARAGTIEPFVERPHRRPRGRRPRRPPAHTAPGNAGCNAGHGSCADSIDRPAQSRQRFGPKHRETPA